MKSLHSIIFLHLAFCSISAGDAAPESQKLASGLTRTLVAREPLLINPVALSVDVDGSIYIAETARRKTADLDIRDFESWIPSTLAFTSVADREAFYRKTLVPGKVPASSPLKDRNGDGVVDFRDLTGVSEKILRLTDEDGDGVIDTSKVFAQNFNSEVTGIAAGVLAWRGDVYASIIPDLWKLRDTKGTGSADRREALLTGFGVHVAYAGHDMHGLIWGPDGKLYWTIGDKGVNVISKEGKQWSVPNEGTVMRCNPDGTGFEIFARGVRNIQQIAFDDDGNLFGVDNDSDAKNEKERFVYLPEHSDSGWRCYYQYRGSKYNPWMAESLSVPSGPGQPAYLTPPICLYHDGPSGFVRNPGGALNDRYRGAFFMTGFPAGILYAFKTETAGAGFRMIDSHVVDQGQAYVGCTFGPDGALYLADWAGGYPLKEKGAVWKLDDPSLNDSPRRREIAEMLETGPTKISDVDLLKRFHHPDQRIRCDAQWELAKRRSGIRAMETAALDWIEEPIVCTHALWGLTQAKGFSPDLFKKLINADSERVRGQAAKWAGETSRTPQPALIPLLRDGSLMVRARAATAIGKLGMTGALDDVLAMLSENANRDANLRHAGVMALVGMRPDEIVEKLVRHESTAVRLAAAVVFRRQASPLAARLLHDKDPAVVAEAARAIYDDSSIPTALPALAELLENRPDVSAPAILRSIATNRVIGDATSAGRLTVYANDRSRPVELRLAALNALVSWSEALELDPVDGRWHPGPAADPAVASPAFANVAGNLAQDADPRIAQAAGNVARALGIVVDPAQLAHDAQDVSIPVPLRLQALGALKSSDDFVSIATRLLKDPSATIRIGAASLLPLEASLNYAIDSSERSTDLTERQNAIRLLAKSNDSQAIGALKRLFENANSTPGLQLDLLEAAEISPPLKPAAEAFRTSLTAKGPLGISLASLTGGNLDRGREVFDTHLAAQCTACHRIGDEGSNVGPPLTHVGAAGREHLLESLLLPHAKLTPGYGIATVVKTDGTIFSGAPKSETADSLTLLTPDGGEVTIRKSEIASRPPGISPMPPMGSILKPTELRDLIEFLSSLN